MSFVRSKVLIAAFNKTVQVYRYFDTWLIVYQGNLIGDPLEIEIFNKIDAKLEVDESAEDDYAKNFVRVDQSQIFQLKQYPFSSDLARASTLARGRLRRF